MYRVSVILCLLFIQYSLSIFLRLFLTPKPSIDFFRQTSRTHYQVFLKSKIEDPKPWILTISNNKRYLRSIHFGKIWHAFKEDFFRANLEWQDVLPCKPWLPAFSVSPFRRLRTKCFGSIPEISARKRRSATPTSTASCCTTTEARRRKRRNSSWSFQIQFRWREGWSEAGWTTDGWRSSLMGRRCCWRQTWRVRFRLELTLSEFRCEWSENHW